MPAIRVKENEPFEVAMRRFKRAVEKTDLLTELRAREAYENRLPNANAKSGSRKTPAKTPAQPTTAAQNVLNVQVQITGQPCDMRTHRKTCSAVCFAFQTASKPAVSIRHPARTL